jgi:hypothetical protein
MLSRQRPTKLVLHAAMLCLMALALAACATFGGSGDKEDLLKAADNFNKALRWEEHKAAAVWVAPPAKKDFWELMDLMRGYVRIMDYDIRDVYFGVNPSTAFVNVRYRVYYKDNPSLHARTLEQEWQFFEKNGVWQVVQPDLLRMLPESLR